MAQSFSEPLRIMLIEDQEQMRHLLAEMLSILGVETVCEAANGREALDKLLEEPLFDAIVTDWNMQPVDGLEFLRDLRHVRFGGAAKTPVLMVTGHANPQRVLAARRLGCRQFLAKPVTRDALGKRLRWVLDHPVEFERRGDYFLPVEIDTSGDVDGEDVRDLWRVG